jgi:NAD(P)-dependent dehydrogenase (short-subunit alcohol dehydrogenase family)
MLLKDKVIVITGAGRGIGRASAHALAQAGAKLVICDLGCDSSGKGSDPSVIEGVRGELRELGAEVVASCHDAARAEDVDALFELATSTFGHIDGVVTCAGTLLDKSLLDLTLEDFESVLRSHLTSTFLCTQAAARLFKKQRSGGSIVHFVSSSGFLGNLGQVNEAAAKAGVFGVTRTASIELQRYGVRVNAIAPLARTRLTEELPIFEKVRGTLEPEHIAPAVVFLLSELSRDVSGTALSVAGGRISAFRLVETDGRMKEVDGGIWTPQEIAENFASISRL